MLDHWGYRYFVIGTELTHMETSLQVHLGLIGVEHEKRTSDLREDSAFVNEFLEKCETLEGFLQDQELGALPGNIAALKARIYLAKKLHRPLYATDLLADIQKIQNDFRLILSNRFFYSIRPESNCLYGKPELFGERVAKKFPKASDDIEWAGNCLALGQPTACVLHLDRAMEISLHHLVKRLGLTPNAKDTLGKILNDIDAPIKQMPDKTEPQKRKKENWSECRINLQHVKSAWRDPGAHGKKKWDERQARDVFDRVKVFMQQLSTLL